MGAYEHVLRHPRSAQARRELVVEWKLNHDPRARVLDLEVTNRDMIRHGLGDGMKLEDAHRILYKHGRTAELAGPVAALTPDFNYEYGLVARIGLPASEFNTKARALVESAPILCATLYSPSDDRSVVDNPALKQILNLALTDGGIDDELAIALSRSEVLKDLRIPTLQSGSLTHRGLAALRSSKNFPNLLSLELTGNPCEHGLIENNGRFFLVGEAGKPFLEQAEFERMNADAYEIMWPPVFDDYAWTE